MIRAILGIAVFIAGMEALRLRATLLHRREDRSRSDLAARAAAMLDDADAEMQRFRAAIGMAPPEWLRNEPLTVEQQIAQGWAQRSNRRASA